MEIPIKNIVLSDWDVRRYPEDEEALDGLILSIQRDGLINPITVTPTTKENNEGYYQV